MKRTWTLGAVSVALALTTAVVFAQREQGTGVIFARSRSAKFAPLVPGVSSYVAWGDTLTGPLAALRSSALDSTQACTLTRLTFCLWSYGALTSTGTMLAPSVLVRAIFSGSRGATSTGAVETVKKGHFSIRRRSASSI